MAKRDYNRRIIDDVTETTAEATGTTGTVTAAPTPVLKLKRRKPVEDPDGDQLLAEVFANAERLTHESVEDLDTKAKELLSKEETLKKELQELEAKKIQLESNRKKAEVEAKLAREKALARKEERAKEVQTLHEALQTITIEFQTFQEEMVKTLNGLMDIAEDLMVDIGE